MARPQAAQGLLGSEALLPRKLATFMGGGPSRSGTHTRHQGFLAQALHQPGPATSLPGNSAHAAALSVALPCYSAQLVQFWPAANFGNFLGSTRLASAT